MNPTQMKQEKTTYGRLRVLTAPPTSVANVHELAQDGGTGSPRDNDSVPFQYDVKIVGTSESQRKGQRRHRPNSGSSVNLQRLNSASATTRDHSITQFALIDDENCSALQNMTKGGGGLTLASQWKSQFDDSEETTDNEWKQEPQSPEHQRIQYIQQHAHKEQHPHYHTLPNKHHTSNNHDQVVHIKTSATQPQSLQNTPSQPIAPPPPTSHQQQLKDSNQTREFYIQHRSRRDYNDQSLKLKLKKKKK